MDFAGWYDPILSKTPGTGTQKIWDLKNATKKKMAGRFPKFEENFLNFSGIFLLKIRYNVRSHILALQHELLRSSPGSQQTSAAWCQPVAALVLAWQVGSMVG